jgi:hypothetical protein
LEQEIMIHVARHHWTDLPSFSLGLAAMLVLLPAALPAKARTFRPNRHPRSQKIPNIG